jgi:hypothetical protein
MKRRSYIALALALAAVLILALWSLWRVHAGARATAAQVQVLGGDAGGLARADPASEHLDAAGLTQAATAAAAEPGFETLIVMRHEHIVFERYARGTAAETVIDSGAFAEGVLGLLVGIAARDDFLPPRSLVGGFRAERLRVAIETATRTPYAAYLGRKLWQPLNAATAWIALSAPGAAAPADCCLHARVLDWLRVAGLLVGDGRFEGTTVAPAGWVARMLRPVSADGQQGFGLQLALAAHGVEPPVLVDAFFLRGPGHWRLWMAPSAHLAVLFGARASSDTAGSADAPGTADAPAAWDETRVPNLVFRALTDAPTPDGPSNLLQRLVPGH